ncbi:tRNA guanosine(34) transglycosylase Tgt [bacterium]|nr:tRNA guanosine(34) transglycosylase Tgt [bacterium]
MRKKVCTPHGSLSLPYYFPVATDGAVRAIAPWELESFGFQGILANTYHLYLRPGIEIIKKAGGLHQWMGWKGVILTDSGGYQVFSLGLGKKKPLIKIKEKGIEFYSHLDGSKHFFTPEKVIQIQLDLKSDIIMPLDVCPPGKSSKAKAEWAAEKTLQWLKIAKNYFEKQTKKLGGKGKKKPLLFAIIQGGTFLDLREKFAKETIKLDFDGYAIGGLAVGEEKRKMWQVVKLMDRILPKNKPRYLMGVGEPKDFVKAVSLGIDMVDCVLPTRLARHGIAYQIIKKRNLEIKNLDLRKSWAKNKLEIIDKNCTCPACQNGLTISYLSHLIRKGEILGHRLLSLHNLAAIRKINEEIGS